MKFTVGATIRSKVVKSEYVIYGIDHSRKLIYLRPDRCVYLSFKYINDFEVISGSKLHSCDKCKI